MHAFSNGVNYVVFICLLFISTYPASAEVRKIPEHGNTEQGMLDNRFQKFSAHFYATLNRTEKEPKLDNINLLEKSIEQHRAKNQPVDAIASIINNLALVEKNIDTTPIIHISRLLFEANEWNTALPLYKKIQKQGDKSLVSNVSFSLAKYYFSRNLWKETIEILESIRSDLPPEDFNHALLMHGISLQHLQKHRAALVEYAKIPPSSRYFVAGRLNMAVSNIRLDSWTDAYIIINELLNDKERKGDSELTDRLYTVLGYSLLQQQYFRNSRDAFRNVGLDGAYTNKALLGIAVTAAYQEDYVGALNAIKILKDKTKRDLPVDEANLLLPYFYERLKQRTTANTGYLKAIEYYEQRIQELKTILQNDSDVPMDQFVTSQSSSITIGNETLDLSERLARVFFENTRLLAGFQPYVERLGDSSLKREYAAVTADYRNVLRKTVRVLVEEKISHLTHYMSQSRYGLARMQDHDVVAPP